MTDPSRPDSPEDQKETAEPTSVEEIVRSLRAQARLADAHHNVCYGGQPAFRMNFAGQLEQVDDFDDD